jgi:transposase
MQAISTIGLDIAKSVFQVHGVDAAGQVVIRRQLRRRHVLTFFQKLPPCLVGSRRARHRTIGPASCRRWAYGAIDAAGLCEALRQAAEERHHGRGSDLRGGHETQHAVRGDQNGRATELSDASSSASSLHPPADCRHQFNPRLSCRVRDCRPCRTQGCRATAGSRRRYNRLPAPGR